MISKVTLKNYRNLSMSTDLDTGNLVIAPNGSGKSNFLESIYFCSYGKSFRPISGISDMVMDDHDFCRAELIIGNDRLETIVSKTTGTKRRVNINGKRSSISKALQLNPIILFAPHSVNLITDDPAGRRNDLNDFLVVLDKNYKSTLSRYTKVLRNRNALLKNIRDHNSTPSELQYWTMELVKLSTQLFDTRLKFFSEITDFLRKTAQQSYSSDEVEFEAIYIPNTFQIKQDLDYSQALLDKYTQNQQKEIVVGQTLYGPHKDDYELNLNGRNLRYLGSRGEQRLGVMVWKLAQHNYLKKVSGHSAIVLIDDIMSELDLSHREKVGELLLENNIQFIVTAATETDLPQNLLNQLSRIEINH